MKKPIVRVGIYLRKSRAKDGAQDLAKHKEYLIEICNRNSWTYELFEEIDSSQNLTRGELQRLRKEIGLGKIDAVMVHAVDRLSRKSRHFLEIIEDYFIAQGMTTLYVKDVEHDLTDPTTITMLQMQATLSQAEYSFIVARLNSGRKQSIKKGIITGKVVYGYYFDKDAKKILKHPEESLIVRKMADMLLEGSTYLSICNTLNSLGYRTRKGNLWDIYNIKSIIHSPVIRGHIMQTWKDETIEVKNSHEAIITDAEYLKIKEILDARAKNYKSLSTAPKHYLQGLLKCPKCKRVMTIACSKPSRKKVNGKIVYSGDYVYYVRTCRPYIKGQDRCGNFGCQAVIVEEMMRSIVKEYQDMVKQKMETLLKTDGDEIKQSKKNMVAEIKKAISKLEAKEENWVETLEELQSGEDVPFDKHYIYQRINKIKDEKAFLIEQLQKAEQELSAVDIEQEIKHQSNLNSALARWDALTDEQKRQTLQMTFKEMWYERFDKNNPPKLRIIPH